MAEFRKARQLIQIAKPVKEQIHREYIEVPGYLYYYEPYEQDMFVHHKVVLDTKKNHYKMVSSWVVSEPHTGLSISAAYNKRKVAVAMAGNHLLQINRKEYHKAILLGLAKAPERKPRWRFPTAKSDPVKVKE